MLTDDVTGTVGGIPMGMARVPGRSVLEGAFALLEVLAAADAGAGLGLTEAAHRAGLPKSTAHRLLEQMCGIGAVERLLRGYVVGPLAGRLVQGRGRLHARIRAAAGKPAIRLAKLTRTDVAVCVLAGSDVLVVAAVSGHSASVPAVSPGTVLPSSTAVAGVLLGGAAHGAAAPIRCPEGRIVAAIGLLTVPARDLAVMRRLVDAAAMEAGHELTESAH
ncbi:helix-turn-helix domain-containing protein [Amycolatopsis sp. w19]|uniref:helix-turn-helix domain-containing protein n=1 Tax=Amycolatopsis sp. w19 TaxID=3448134 RepID=UPI003F1992D4